MIRPVVAITTGVYYVDKTKWCVKDLKIGHRLDGTHFWSVSAMGCNFESEADAERAGVDIAKFMQVPFFFHIKHGAKITRRERLVLKQYGIKEVR